MNSQQNDSMETSEEIMRRYPRITAHIIAESLGYATPTCAARILRDAKHRQENWCEWIYSCYKRNALRAVQNSIRNRRHHTGYMAEYRLAKAPWTRRSRPARSRSSQAGFKTGEDQ